MQNIIKPPRKYNIERLLRNMDGSYTENKYRLCIALGITNRTLEDWIKIRKYDKRSIKGDHLDDLASFFKVSPLNLLNSQ